MTVLEPRVIGCRVTASKSQHSQPLGGHALDGFVRLRFVERNQFAAIIECVRAAFDQPLGRALLVNQAPGAAVMQGRHELEFGLERDRVQSRVRDGQFGFE